MAYATITDLAAGWRPLSPSEQTRAETLLERAAVILDQWERIPESNPNKAALLKIASCEMVSHAFEARGDAFGIVQDSNDSLVWSPDNPAGNMWLSSQTLKALGVGVAKVSSIRAAR